MALLIILLKKFITKLIATESLTLSLGAIASVRKSFAEKKKEISRFYVEIYTWCISALSLCPRFPNSRSTFVVDRKITIKKMCDASASGKVFG